MTLGAAFPEILAAARTGAEWAWERLVGSVAGQVRGYLAAQGASDPDDLTGEVLLQLVRGVHRFDGDEAGFRAWIFLIAHHRLIDERRRAHRLRALGARQDAPTAASGADALFDSTSGIDWPEHLGQLSSDQRDVLLLRVVGGLPAEEVARILGKRVGTIRVLQHRALARLRIDLAAAVTR